MKKLTLKEKLTYLLLLAVIAAALFGCGMEARIAEHEKNMVWKLQSEPVPLLVQLQSDDPLIICDRINNGQTLVVEPIDAGVPLNIEGLSHGEKGRLNISAKNLAKEVFRMASRGEEEAIADIFNDFYQSKIQNL